MIAHPKTMQTVIDQRWHELRVETQRERLAMTAQEQTPGGTPLPTLRLRVVSAMRMLPPILSRGLELRVSGDARRPAVP